VVSSISLLMLVAFAVQASAGVTAPALQARQDSGLPVIRLIAEVVSRHVDRQVKRQEERPAVCRTTWSGAEAANSAAANGAGHQTLAARRLLVLLTNLPPPARA
jgi:hypothetical protein